MQNRFKSWALWTAIVAQVLSLAQLTGVFAALGLDMGAVGDFIAGVLQILVLLGVLNNPENPSAF